MQSEGTNGSRGQRLSLPSSVIICTLVPLFVSWLSETNGSSLPGLANGDETAKSGAEMALLLKQFWKQHFAVSEYSFQDRSETLTVVLCLKVKHSGLKSSRVTALTSYNHNKSCQGNSARDKQGLMHKETCFTLHAKIKINQSCNSGVECFYVSSWQDSAAGTLTLNKWHCNYSMRYQYDKKPPSSACFPSFLFWGTMLSHLV